MILIVSCVAFSSLFILQILSTWIIISELVCPEKVWLFLSLLSHFLCPSVFFPFLFQCFFLSSQVSFFVIKTVTNFIMKAFINGRKVFGTPVKAFPPVYPSQMVSIHSLNTSFAYCGGITKALKFSLFCSHPCRSISLILKSSLREKWLQMTAAAASVARSDTSWKTAPCVRSRYNHRMSEFVTQLT